MSVLVIGRTAESEPVVRHLLQEGDDVGVIESDRGRLREWASLGAHAALGSPEDPDLVERCAQQARTIVFCESPGAGGGGPTNVLRSVLEAGRMLPQAPRVVVVSPAPSLTLLAQLNSSALDYILLRNGLSRGFLRRGPKVVAAEDLARAVSASDDLAGEPRLDLDLSRAAGWETLRLAPPDYVGA